MGNTLPFFHLYGDPPDDQAFDFIHVETIASRSSIHDWTIRAHRHRNLFQILIVERGRGEMIYETAQLPFTAPAAILIPAAVTHGFRFASDTIDGWVATFTEDAALALADRGSEALARLGALAMHPIIPISGENDRSRLSGFCKELLEEGALAREGYRVAMRGLLALLAIGVARLAASRARGVTVALHRTDATVTRLQALVDEFFRTEHQLGFYAEKLGMTVDRLNDHVKRAAGVTAGHLVRQRLLTEAKRRLVFTIQPIQDIAAELSFADASHFARFFRRYTGMTPHAFRDRRV
jgi:AraC family transcriptional regulator, transcriptional activator of pobA